MSSPAVDSDLSRQLSSYSLPQLKELSQKSQMARAIAEAQLACKQGELEVKRRQDQLEHEIKRGELELKASKAQFDQKMQQRENERAAILQLAKAESLGAHLEQQASFRQSALRNTIASQKYDAELQRYQEGILYNPEFRSSLNSILLYTTILAIGLLVTGILAKKQVKPFQSISPSVANTLIIVGAVTAPSAILLAVANRLIPQSHPRPRDHLNH